ncbi:unnamed protein product, partial [Allacma fusca]
KIIKSGAMRLSVVLFLTSILLGVALSQDSSEESPIPKKTLRKYRVRRPIAAPQEQDDGSGRPTGPARVRRIRIKQRPTEAPQEAPLVLQEQYEQPQPSPQPQLQRQIVISPQRAQQVCILNK